MPKKRNRAKRELKPQLHIFCEGKETEPFYFRRYLEIYYPGIRLVSIPNIEENTPVQLVKKAIREKKKAPKGDLFWTVYDRESEIKYSKKLHDQARKMAKKHDINIALSNVCFEVWILLHFTKDIAPYDNFDDLKRRSRLKEFIPKYGKSIKYPFSKKEMNAARIRASLINKATQAGADSFWNQPHQWNPYTDVHKLLDAMDHFLAYVNSLD